MAVSECLLVRGASQIVTVRGQSGPRRGLALGELNIVENGAILIENGIIQHVGPSHRVENFATARKAREVDTRGGVVLPGFVDSHTHFVAPKTRQGDEVEVFCDNVAARGHSIAKLRAHAKGFLSWMASHGTTTAEVKCCCSGDDVFQLRELRTVQSLHNEPIGLVAGVFAAGPGSGLAGNESCSHAEWCERVLLPAVARRNLAAFADLQCGREGYSLSDARLIMETAAGLGMGVRIHANSQQAFNAIMLAVSMGAVSVDHLDGVSPACVDVLAGSRTIATLVPSLMFQGDASMHPPARALIDGGAAVALATGFDGINSTSCSMPMVLSLACSSLRLTAAEAICAATINGAHALLCADRAGSLEVGKQADFVVASVRDYRELPYYFGVQTISRVFRRGVEISPERK